MTDQEKRYGLLCDRWTLADLACGEGGLHELARDLLAVQATIAVLEAERAKGTYSDGYDAGYAAAGQSADELRVMLDEAEATIARARRFVRALRSTAALGSSLLDTTITADQLEAALVGDK